MKVVNVALVLMLMISAVINHGLQQQRDDWKDLAHLMTGLYNGLLIGRGCEIPE